MFKVVAVFSNGRTSEHVYDSLTDAAACALRIEAGSFATVTVYRDANA